MTDKELILETLKFLKPKSGHTDIVSTLWKDLNLDADKQCQLRDILLTGELINLGEDLWTMRLTAKGMLITPDQLDNNGNIRLENIIIEQKDEIKQLTIDNLTLQNEKLRLETKHLNNKVLYAIIGFISVVILLAAGAAISTVLRKY